METPFKCAAANVTEYLRVTDSEQEINIDEGEVTW